MVGVIAVGMPLIRSSSVSALTNSIEIGRRPDLSKRRGGRSGIGLHREIGGLCGLKPTRPIIAGTGSIQRGPSSSRTRNRFTSYSSMVFSPKMYRQSSLRLTTSYRNFFGFHSLANFCASATWSGVIRDSRYSLPFSASSRLSRSDAGNREIARFNHKCARI